MKAGGGKQKGAQFERDVCVKLSLWVTGGEKRDCFWRSAMSGGRATISGRKGIDLSRQAGDISAIAPEGHSFTNLFYIEAKFYKSLEIPGFVYGSGGVLSQFWETCKKEAKKHKRQPMLIAKENGRPPLVIVRPRTLDRTCGAPYWLRSKLQDCDLLDLEGMTSYKYQVTVVL